MEKGQFKEMSVPVKWSIGTGKLTDLLSVQLSHYQRRSGNEQLAGNLYNLFLDIKNSFWYCELGTLMSEPVSTAFFCLLLAHLHIAFRVRVAVADTLKLLVTRMVDNELERILKDLLVV
jgi:hypothetical protein